MVVGDIIKACKKLYVKKWSVNKNRPTLYIYIQKNQYFSVLDILVGYYAFKFGQFLPRFFYIFLNPPWRQIQNLSHIAFF